MRRWRCWLGLHEWRHVASREFMPANYPVIETLGKCWRCRKLKVWYSDMADHKYD